jgi:HEAT repeat protein
VAIKWLKTPPSESVEREEVIDLLAAIGPEASAAVPALTGFLKEPKSYNCSRAIHALGRIGPASSPAVELITGALDVDTNYYTRSNAAEALARIGPDAKSAVKALKAAANGKDVRLRIWATAALARISGDEDAAVSFLVKAMQNAAQDRNSNDDERTAGEAFVLLGPGACGKAAPAIIPLRESYHTGADEARVSIVAAGRPVTKAAVTYVVKYAQKTYSSDRPRWIVALGEMGPAATEACPYLEGLVDEVDDGIGLVARAALKKIRGN